MFPLSFKSIHFVLFSLCRSLDVLSPPKRQKNKNTWREFRVGALPPAVKQG